MLALTSNRKHTGAGNRRAPDLLLRHWQKRYGENDNNVTEMLGIQRAWKRCADMDRTPSGFRHPISSPCKKGWGVLCEADVIRMDIRQETSIRNKTTDS